MRVQSNREVWQVFENVGWDIYFDRPRGLNEEIMVDFALNTGEGGFWVRVIKIPVTEEIIVEISRLLQVRECWF